MPNHRSPKDRWNEMAKKAGDNYRAGVRRAAETFARDHGPEPNERAIMEQLARQVDDLHRDSAR